MKKILNKRGSSIGPYNIPRLISHQLEHNKSNPGADLEPTRTFSQKQLTTLAVNYFHKIAASQMFGWVLNMPLQPLFPVF